MRRFSTFLIAVLMLVQRGGVRADDYGPHPDLRDVSATVKRLLAHRLRAEKIDPGQTAVSDVVVVKNQAMASWSAGPRRGVMGLMRYGDRWWDAFDASRQPVCVVAAGAFPAKVLTDPKGEGPLDAASIGFDRAFIDIARTHNSAFAALQTARAESCNNAAKDPFEPKIVPGGGLFTHARRVTGGYQVDFAYAPNTAAAGDRLSSMRARAPTETELLTALPPAPGAGYSTGVAFFYFDLNAKRTVSFQKGGQFDVWVPWTMSDQVHYELEIYAGRTVVGPIKAAPFDNVLHFELPAFTLPPGETLGEIDGYW